MRQARLATAPPLLSVEQAARYLGASRSTIYRSIERGDFPLPTVRLNGRLRIPRRAVERLVAGESLVDSPLAGPVETQPRHARGLSRTLPTCSAARRSSSPIASV